MAQITYSISINAGDLSRAIGQEVAGLARDTLGRLAENTANRWRDAVASQRGIWIEEKNAYAGSIDWQMTGDFSALVWTDYKHAAEIETGRPARDLKKMLDTSTKVRQGKGGRYLVIPFRHNVPSKSGQSSYAPQMPRGVYLQAKRLSPSSVTGQGERASGTGAYSVQTRKFLTVPQNQYAWGQRLSAGLAPKLKASHSTDPYAGMVRMDTSTGGKRSSAYLTFRVMTEKQHGKWIIPAQPGRFIAKKVAEEAGRMAEGS